VLWIPITIAAAAFQTARNAFQRSLTGALSALGATYTRFAFGLPFAALYALVVFAAGNTAWPEPPPAFFAWSALGGVAQIAATAFLLQLFQLRNFATGIAFSKSEILQVALVGVRMLGLVEVLFGFGVTVLAHRERPSRRELVGTALLVLGIAVLLLERVSAGGVRADS
jgi:drug/metabolite transporter (DMT)-like permease